MELSLPANFDEELLDQVRDTAVAEVYGRFAGDRGGGGRARFMLAPVGRGRFAQYVAAVHRRGLRFNYLINAACFGNREFTRAGQRDLNRLLDWLTELGVETITVSVPSLLELIKARYPHFRVKIGVYAHITTPQQARHWEDLGADCITVESISANREFGRLRALRRAVHCDLQLLASCGCLQFCPFSYYHAAGLSHASRPGTGLFLDYCVLRCSLLKLADPVNYLRADWIRPEDLALYEELGYSSFKLTERGSPSELLLTRARAYTARHYEGNLLDLVQAYGHRAGPAPTQPRLPRLWEFREFVRPRQVSPGRLLPWRELIKQMGMLFPLQGDPPVHIDNRALDGFLDPMRARSCAERDCGECGHCARTAARAVHVDPEHRARCLALGQAVLGDLNAGVFWGASKRTSP